MDAGRNGIHDFVCRGHGGVGDPLVLELHCVTEAFAVGVFDVALVGPVVFGRGLEVPTVNGVECPGAAGIGLLVDLDIATHRR